MCKLSWKCVKNGCLAKHPSLCKVCVQGSFIPQMIMKVKYLLCYWILEVLMLCRYVEIKFWSFRSSMKTGHQVVQKKFCIWRIISNKPQVHRIRATNHFKGNRVCFPMYLVSAIYTRLSRKTVCCAENGSCLEIHIKSTVSHW